MKPVTIMRLHDGTTVIVGDHFTIEEAEARFGARYRKMFKRTDKITWVAHGWIRYERVGTKRSKEECCDYTPGQSLWFLHEKRKPRGELVREVTIL